MTVKELIETRRKWLDRHVPYQRRYYKNFDYSILSNIMYRKKGGRGSNEPYNDVRFTY